MQPDIIRRLQILLDEQGLIGSTEDDGTILIGEGTPFATSDMYSFKTYEAAFEAVASGEVLKKIKKNSNLP